MSNSHYPKFIRFHMVCLYLEGAIRSLIRPRAMYDHMMFMVEGAQVLRELRDRAHIVTATTSDSPEEIMARVSEALAHLNAEDDDDDDGDQFFLQSTLEFVLGVVGADPSTPILPHTTVADLNGEHTADALSVLCAMTGDDVTPESNVRAVVRAIGEAIGQAEFGGA